MRQAALDNNTVLVYYIFTVMFLNEVTLHPPTPRVKPHICVHKLNKLFMAYYTKQ